MGSGQVDLPKEVVEAFHEVLAPRLTPAESVSDFLSGAAELGHRRATLFNREFYPTDVEFALSLFCRWPFKPPTEASYRRAVDGIRASTFQGASLGRTDELNQLVPDETLLLSIEELFDRQRREEGARKLLRLRGQATA